ncbi:polynucleotide 5'-hydroxyl-kinase NOL9 isoform X1 [Osmia bicornis bicornis]|uniref:polynucleotide 5'-hydroxyl-kinase NOL9 isoform X1 n=2 Tax=Osmia bicornis bicornis TaxID=1437191 RepID=UPI001EAF2E22|nr:polynucleotide 5'-hydroxyl-kinase NOL9 isoform X1 [Osmia bicornis bicornis]
MKTTQIKKLKTKILKIGTKQSKAILPQYKAKHQIVYGKKKSFLKGLIMNSSRAKSKTVQNASLNRNSPNKKQGISECIVKQRKKKSRTVPKEFGSAKQNSMGLFFESNHDSAGTPLTSESCDKRCSDISEQRNIGAPVIVEALSDSLSSLSIPQVFRQNQKARAQENDVADFDPSYMENVDAQQNEIIVTRSSNENNNSNNEGNHNRISSPPKSNRRQRKHKKSLETSNTNDPNSSPEKPSVSVSRKEEEFFVDEGNDEDNGTTEANVTCVSSSNAIPNDQYSVRFYCLKNKIVAVMAEKSRFCFTGKLVVKVIYGAVQAYGYVVTAKNSPIEIYSPRGYSNVSIETGNGFSVENQSDIWTSLNAEGINRGTENKLVVDIDQIQSGMAVVLLWNLENKLTKFLNAFYPFRLFPKIRNGSYHSWSSPKRAEVILQSNLYSGNNDCKELIVDPRVAYEVGEKMLNDWRAKKWSCALIAGGKSVGKSTSSRYLINSILATSKRVVLVDVDPGQTECTPAGSISYSLIEEPLMGPNFTHLKTPVFQLYIGDVNVSRCITRYIESMRLLIDKLLQCPVLSQLPIVVNTMGFSQGIGWEIIMYTIKLIRPSLVVQIMSEKAKNNYIGYLSKQVVNRQQPWSSWSVNVIDWNRPCDHELYVVRSHAERKAPAGYETWNMEPYQQRELVMISYLSEIAHNSTSRNNVATLSINEAVPYATPLSSLFISIPRTFVPPTHVLNVINGNIVALCGIDIQDDDPQRSETTSGPRILDRSPLCPCYGFGIVRGVDMEREEVFINTPLPVYVMQYVNCLMGCMPVPVTLLQLNQQKNVPYTGGNHVLPMSREPRRGYFRMRYQRVQNNA